MKDSQRIARKLNLKQIDAFRTVFITGSTVEAATHLHISQPSVSRSLKNFEDSVSYELFVRRNGRLFPTPEAEALYVELDSLYKSFDHIRNVMTREHPTGNGQMVIVASTPLAQRFVPYSVAAFQTERPNVPIKLHIVAKHETRQWLETQQFDLALLTLPIDYPSTHIETLAKVDAVCVLPADHPLARKEIVSAKDLAHEYFISIAHATLLRMRVDRAFDRLGIERSHMLIETQTSASICQMVSAGLGVSVIDPFNAAAFQSNSIAIRRFRPHISFTYGLIRPTQRQAPPHVDEFSQLLKTRIADS